MNNNNNAAAVGVNESLEEVMREWTKAVLRANPPSEDLAAFTSNWRTKSSFRNFYTSFASTSFEKGF